MPIAVLASACIPGPSLPSVQEPLDSKAWVECAGALEERESMGLIDDLTLDSKTLLCGGVVAAAKGKTDQAIDMLTEAGVRDQTDFRPHYLSGRILAEAGRYEEALSAFERSKKRFSNMDVPAERLGRKVAEKDGDEPARAFLEKARERGFCSYGCLGLLAMLEHKAKQDDKAEGIYSEMIASDPAEPAAYVGMALLANAKEDYLAESEWLTKATNASKFNELSDQKQAEIHYSHAFSRYNSSKLKGAAKSIDRAISLVGDRADWWVLAGWIQMKSDNPPMALTKFEKAISIDSELAAAHTGRGDALLELNRIDEALESFEAARELSPLDTVVILKLAYAKARSGQKEEARALVEEARGIDANHMPAELIEKLSSVLN